MSDPVRDIVKLIQGARRILLICHIDPDGDAIGSIVGLGEALRRLGKRVTLACPSPTPAKLGFLLGKHRVTTRPRGNFDLAIALDCSDLRRLNAIYEQIILPASTPLANIDHHVTNTNFGIADWVDPSAAAVCEMVIELVDQLGVKINPDIARPLLTGLVTDTRGFRTPNTTPHVLRMASRLIEVGVPLADVMEHTLNRRSYGTICLWRQMLDTVELRDRIISAVLTVAVQRSCRGVDDGDAGLVNFLASTEEADAAAVFQEQSDGTVDIGFRSKPGVSVAEVARELGGGGHPQAAGCTVAGPLEEVRASVLAALCASLARRAAAGEA